MPVSGVVRTFIGGRTYLYRGSYVPVSGVVRTFIGGRTYLYRGSYVPVSGSYVPVSGVVRATLPWICSCRVRDKDALLATEVLPLHRRSALEVILENGQ